MVNNAKDIVLLLGGNLLRSGLLLGLQAIDANLDGLAIKLPGLEIDVLPLQSLAIGMGTHGAGSGTASANGASFSHIFRDCNCH
jgi:hypothetical protein